MMPYVVKKRTFTYATAHATLNTLDYYEPKGLLGQKPAVMFIIGGGFSSASATNRAKWDAECNELASIGYVCTTISYRGGSSYHLPETMVDVNAALDWMKGHQDVDPARICAWGRSAGSFMAAQLGNEAKVKLFMGECGPYDLVGITEPDAVAWLDGADPAVVSPRYNVTASASRSMLVHGTADTTVLPVQSANMKAALDAAGVPCTLRTHSGGHGTLNSSVRPAFWTAQKAFLASYL